MSGRSGGRRFGYTELDAQELQGAFLERGGLAQLPEASLASAGGSDQVLGQGGQLIQQRAEAPDRQALGVALAAGLVQPTESAGLVPPGLD